jgi:hypothetical protein
MKARLVPLLLLVASLFANTGRAQTSEQQERLTAAFVLALGRLPSATEITDSNPADRPSLAALYSQQSERLKSDPAARRSMVIRACRDAFGRIPTESEIATWSAGNATYADLMKQHVAWLSGHPEAGRQAIDLAYRHLISRPAYDLELDYWKPRGSLPYVLLVGAIENWAQRNAPGLTVTSGTPSISVNSRFLATARLSPAVANEARAILGLPIWTDVARLKNPGCNIVAVGASEIASVGGIHCLIVGLAP